MPTRVFRPSRATSAVGYNAYYESGRVELLIGPSHAKVARSRLNVLVYFNLRGQIIHCLGNVDATKHPHPCICDMGLARPKHHAAAFIVRRWQRGTVSTSDRQPMGSIRRPLTNGVVLIEELICASHAILPLLITGVAGAPRLTCQLFFHGSSVPFY